MAELRESGVNPSPRPAVLYLSPTGYPLLKTIVHFHSPQEGGTMPGPQPVFLLHSPTWMEKPQGCPGPACPGSMRAASRLSKSKLSWVKPDLQAQTHRPHSHLCLWKQGQDSGEEGFKPHLQETLGPLVGRKRKDVPSGALMSSQPKTVPLWKVFTELLKIPITESLESKELRISSLAYPQLSLLGTLKLHGFLDTRALTLRPPPSSKNKNKSPLANTKILFLSQEMKAAFQILHTSTFLSHQYRKPY